MLQVWVHPLGDGHAHRIQQLSIRVLPTVLIGITVQAGLGELANKTKHHLMVRLQGRSSFSHRQQTVVIITLSRTKETSSSVSSTSAGCCSGQHAAILILREHASTCRLPPDPSLVVIAGSPQPVAAKLLQGLLSEGSDPIKHRDFTCWEMRALEFFSLRVRKSAPKLRAVSGPELRNGEAAEGLYKGNAEGA